MATPSSPSPAYRFMEMLYAGKTLYVDDLNTTKRAAHTVTERS
jgi:hypothetical protein